MRLKKIDVAIVFIANDVTIAMATSYRYDVISSIASCNIEFYGIASLFSDKIYAQTYTNQWSI